jgi:hypothetical protein
LFCAFVDWTVITDNKMKAKQASIFFIWYCEN